MRCIAFAERTLPKAASFLQVLEGVPADFCSLRITRVKAFDIALKRSNDRLKTTLYDGLSQNLPRINITNRIREELKGVEC